MRLFLIPASLLVLQLCADAVHADSKHYTQEDDLDLLSALSMEELLNIKITTGDRGGTRLIGSPVPIEIITAEELQYSGYTELSKVLQRIVASFNYPRVSIGDGSDHWRPFMLRGLSSDQVLVLINGKRRHGGALVHVNNFIGRGSTNMDLNTIPIIAIERIEIVHDGATAQYGSDAIAGVVNIILKSGPSTDVSTTFGKTSHGDGQVRQVDFHIGTELEDIGFFNVIGEIRDRRFTNRAGPDLRQQFFAGDPRNDLAPQVTFRVGDAEALNRSLGLNTEMSLNEALDVYAFGFVNYQESDAAGFFRVSQDDATVRAIHPNGFLPRITPDILDAAITLGARGRWQQWRWDISNTVGSNYFQFNIRNSNNASLGVASPTRFDSGTLFLGQDTFNIDLFKTIEMGMAHPLDFAIGAELRFENYQIKEGETASFINGGVAILDGPNQGQPAPIGAQVFAGFQPINEVDETRNSIAFYIDLEQHFNADFLLGFAARYEYFSDLGGKGTEKIVAAYAPTDALLLRLSASTGFRAPSLQQSFFNATTTAFINGVPFEFNTLKVDDPIAIALGAQALEPENSLHFSTGMVFTPSKSLQISADIFFIQVEDRIVLSSDIIQDAAAFGVDAFNILQAADIGGTRFFTNAIDTQTHGLDLNVQKDWHWLDYGSLTLTGDYHYNQTKIIDVNVSGVLANNADVVFNSEERNRIEKGQPRHTSILTGIYHYRRYHLLLRAIRAGSTVIPQLDQANNVFVDKRIDVHWLFDMELGYQFNNNVSVAIGGHNIFDERPEFLDNSADDDFIGQDRIFQFSPFSPFGFNGAFYYARLNIHFD